MAEKRPSETIEFWRGLDRKYRTENGFFEKAFLAGFPDDFADVWEECEDYPAKDDAHG